MNPLLRYVNQETGPISYVTSLIQPGFFKPFYWYSIAKMSDDYRSNFGSRFVIPSLTYGWDRNKQKSQEKAVQAALIIWAQKIYHDRDDNLLGKNINVSDDGFAIAHSLPENEVCKIAKRNAIHAWAKRQLIKKSDWTLRLASLPFLNRERLLLTNNKGRLLLLYSPINVANEEYFFAISIFQFSSGACILGSACENTKSLALEVAVVECYSRYRFINRVQNGSEQLLDKINLQRQWLFATDDALGKNAVDLFLSRIALQSRWIINDPVLFSKTIFLDKDLILHRMLYTRSLLTPDNLTELPL